MLLQPTYCQHDDGNKWTWHWFGVLRTAVEWVNDVGDTFRCAV